MTEWHVPEKALVTWRDGTASLASAVSVEKHLEGCGLCQRVVAALPPTTDTVDLDAVWQGIADQVEAPRRSLAARIMMRMGVAEPTAIVIGSAPALSAAWVSGVAFVLLFAVAAGSWSETRAIALFLTLAPLVPAVGVSASYGSEMDPTHELTIAAPYSKLRLLMLRTAAVLAVSIPLSIAAAVPLEGPWWVAVVWLLPAVAFVALSLAAATFFSPHYATATISVVWVTASMAALWQREPLALFNATALVCYAALALIGLVLLTGRATHLATDWRLP